MSSLHPLSGAFCCVLMGLVLAGCGTAREPSIAAPTQTVDPTSSEAAIASSHPDPPDDWDCDERVNEFRAIPFEPASSGPGFMDIVEATLEVQPDLNLLSLELRVKDTVPADPLIDGMSGASWMWVILTDRYEYVVSLPYSRGRWLGSVIRRSPERDPSDVFSGATFRFHDFDISGASLRMNLPMSQLEFTELREWGTMTAFRGTCYDQSPNDDWAPA